MKNFLSRVFFKLFKKRISVLQLRRSKGSNKPIKLIIGSGHTIFKGWIITDIVTLNIIKSSDWEKHFTVNSISSIVAEHIFEHLTEVDRNSAFLNIFTYLQVGGNLRIAVPDSFNPNMEYIENVKPGGIGDGALDHKFLYGYKDLSKILEGFGFKVNLLEYYDEFGEFHLNPWFHERGIILRSAINDRRNKNGDLKYTSLILDAIKN